MLQGGVPLQRGTQREYRHATSTRPPQNVWAIGPLTKRRGVYRTAVFSMAHTYQQNTYKVHRIQIIITQKICFIEDLLMRLRLTLGLRLTFGLRPPYEAKVAKPPHVGHFQRTYVPIRHFRGSVSIVLS